MRAVLSLPLACLLAQAWQAPDSTLASRLPEVQAGLETLLTARAQNQTNQTSERLWAPEEEEGEEDSPWLSTEGQKLSREASSLGFSLLRKISLEYDGNVVFSPLGLAWATAALTLGTGGHSRAQLEELLSQAWNQTRPPRLPALFKRLRESLFHNPELGLVQGSFAFIHKDFDIRENFLNLSKRYFNTECVTVNFRNASQAKRLMNHYMNQQTQGKLPKLFDEINPDTELILVDYILFKGTWITFCSSRAVGLFACLFLSFWACVWLMPKDFLGTCSHVSQID